MVAESVLVKHQLRILNRGRKRTPNLCAADRIIAGLCTLFMRPTRVLRSAIVLKTSTLLYLHNLLKNESTACCLRPSTGVGLARRDRGKNHRRRRCHETA